MRGGNIFSPIGFVSPYYALPQCPYYPRGGGMLERRIEAALVKAARDVGGMALKWTSPGMTGVPDRIVFLPKGRIVFVELKAPGKKPTPLQLKVQQQIRDLGFQVEVIDSMEAARAITL